MLTMTYGGIAECAWPSGGRRLPVTVEVSLLLLPLLPLLLMMFLLLLLNPLALTSLPLPRPVCAGDWARTTPFPPLRHCTSSGQRPQWTFVVWQGMPQGWVSLPYATTHPQATTRRPISAQTSVSCPPPPGLPGTRR